jgi:hypothetical protein
MGQRAYHRIGREASKRAQRTEFHGVTEIFEQCRVVGTVVVANNAVNHFDAARGANPAGRALAAGLNGAEFHRETRLLGHIDRVVEHDDPAMADQADGFGEGLIVEGKMKQRPRKVGAEGTADLHRAHRTAAAAATTDAVDELTKGDAERRLVEARILDVPRELDRHGAA